MEWLQLNTYTVASLAAFILSLAVALYLLSVKQKTRATWWLVSGFGFLTLCGLVWVAWSGVSPLASGWIYAPPLVAFFYTGWIVSFLQFAYTFLGNPFPREAKAVRGVTAGAGVFYALCVVYYLVFSREVWIGDVFWFIFPLATIVWIPGVFVRKAVYFHVRHRSAEPVHQARFLRAFSEVLRQPAGRDARAMRAFALLCLVVACGPLADELLKRAGVLSLVESIYLQSFTVLVLGLGVVVLYVNHTPEPITFQVKLVGLSLVTVLVLWGMASLLLFPPEQMVRGSGIHLPVGHTLRFEPDQQRGYHVDVRPLAFAPDPGQRLDLQGDGCTAVPLDFSFPFYGELWANLLVSANGVVALGHFPDVSQKTSICKAALNRNFYDEVPKIAPFFTNWAGAGHMEVFYKRVPDAATITWQWTPVSDENDLVYDAPDRYTFQLVLSADGTITFAYDDVEAPATVGGVRGIYPGGADPVITPVTFGDGPPVAAAAGAGVVEDTLQRFRRYMNARIAPLAYLMLGAALIILVGFPLFFHASLVRPLGRLLEGVRHTGAGDLSVRVPVRTHDEIGMLTEHFNQMGASLQTAHAELQAYAEELESRVATRTAELELSKGQLEAQARHLEELDALKSRFFANVSHELRTPLTLLLGPIADAREYGDAERLLRQVPLMHRNANRLLTLIVQLLDLAKLEAGGMHLHARRVDLAYFLHELVLTFAGRAEREKLRLLFDTSAPELWCYVDPDKLEIVVTNLLSNAFKFTDAGGKVRLGLRRVKQGTEEMAELTVEDTGMGIREEEVPHIFDRFHQGEASTTLTQAGTGIGLALVKELVTLHGGTIHVTSKRGFGTTFTVCLPLRTEHLTLAENDDGDVQLPVQHVEELAAPRATASMPKPTEADSDASRPLVLVVEDNEDMRSYLRSLLAANYRVLEAEDGTAGLALARTSKPDLILSDLMMPVMNGYDLCRALKTDETLGHVPVVLLTARADDESRLEGLGLGADDYLQKPFQSEELLLRVENLIEVRRCLRARFSQEIVVGPLEVVVPSAEAAFLERVQAVVETHLGDTNFGVDWLADEVGLSRRQLGRRMKAATGLSPSGYVRMMRLERAAQLLEQQVGTVQEIAYRVGFNDAEYFSKLFRQAFDVLPSAYPETKEHE